MSHQLRARRTLRLPVDPLQIRSMGDYDFTLLNSRTWFNYDESRKALPGLIEHWSFEPSENKYVFHISPSARWSDGSPVTVLDLIFNLNRAIQIGGSYGSSLSGLLDFKSIQIVNDKELSVQIFSSQNAGVFFERIGSAFFSLVHPNETNEKLDLISNTLSCGPFAIAAQNASELVMKKNPYHPNPPGPDQIIFRDADPYFSIESFCRNETWENYFQTNSFIPTKEAHLLSQSKLPIWTRDFDRVSLLRVGNGDKHFKQRQNLLKAVELQFASMEISRHPFPIQKATSLQPEKYPLFDVLKYGSSTAPTDHPKNVKLLAIAGPNTDFHREILSPVFKKLDISVAWEMVLINDFVQALKSNTSYDLALVSYGVADPEPSTWMSLTMDSEFIHVLPEEKKTLQKAFQSPDRGTEIKTLKSLLRKMHARGSYMPLLWGSTLSVGQPNMSFELIKPTDETVDLSKIVFKP